MRKFLKEQISMMGTPVDEFCSELALMSLLESTLSPQDTTKGTLHQQQQQDTFLSLPPEIRNEIYSYLSPHNTSIPSCTGLLLTNKQIHAEYKSSILHTITRTLRSAESTSLHLWSTYTKTPTPPFQITNNSLNTLPSIRNISITFPICFYTAPDHRRRRHRHSDPSRTKQHSNPSSAPPTPPTCEDLLMPIHAILALHVPYVTVRFPYSSVVNSRASLRPLDAFDVSYRACILRFSLDMFKAIQKQYEVNAHHVVFDFSENTVGPLGEGVYRPYVAFVKDVRKSGRTRYRFLGVDPWPGMAMEVDIGMLEELDDVVRRSRRIEDRGARCVEGLI